MSIIVRDLFNENSHLMKFMKWVEQFVHLQWLLILYTIRGFIFGGLFPSIVALFASMRMLIRDENHPEINSFFKKEYKENFKISNIIGYGTSVINILLVINLHSAQMLQNKVGFAYVFISYSLIIFMMIVSVSIWAFLVHFDLSIGQLIKHTVAILLLNPLHTGLIFVLFIIFIWSSIRFGILLPVILVSVLSFGITLVVQNALRRTERLQKQKAN